MKHSAFIVSIAALLGSTVLADRHFTIRTNLKPNQPGKERFDNLYMLSTKTGNGAALNDAIFVADAIEPADNSTTSLVKAQLVPVKDKKIKANNQQSSEFIAHYDNSGHSIKMIMRTGAPELTDWQSVMLNGYNKADPTTSGFYMDDDGLQYENSEPVNGVFGGWLVCEWYHDSKPQLFFRFAKNHAVQVPDSCADVDLIPVYLKEEASKKHHRELK